MHEKGTMMREVKTTRFGNVQVTEEQIIHFAEGIPSFESEREFIIVPYEGASFVFLQSVQTPDLAFLMINPFEYFADYEFTLKDDVMNKLGIQGPEGVAIFNFLTIPGGNVAETTANLLAPIIINQKNREACQLILEDSPYTTKHKLSQQSVEEDKGSSTVDSGAEGK